MEKVLTPRDVDELGVIEGKTRTAYFDIHPDAPPGFFLRVTNKGARTFFLVATVRATGKRIWVRIGAARGPGLDKARRAAYVRLGEIQRDIDPNETAKAAKVRAAAERRAKVAATLEWSVSDMMTAHLDAQKARGEISKNTLVSYNRVLREISEDVLGRMVARSVVRDDVRRWIARKEKDGPTAARMPLARLGAAYRWALDEEVMEPGADGRPTARARVDRDPTRRMASAEKPRRERVLSDDELVVYWRGLDGGTLPQAVFARLILLAGTRKFETYNAQWENVRVDGDAPEWSIPAEDRKGKNVGTGRRRPLTVPLSPLAVAELRVLRGAQPMNKGRVFRGVNSQGKINGELQRLSGIPDVTIHDLRRTCATGLQRLGAPPHVISIALGHSREAGATIADAAYTHDRRAGEHRDWLDRWARHIEGLLDRAARKDRGADVLPFKA